MIVVGSMIGSGIFIVAADISRQTGFSRSACYSRWIITGLLTVRALSYGELAALFASCRRPVCVFARKLTPHSGISLWLDALSSHSTRGTIAAVAVGFARYLACFPSISPTAWIIPPIALSSKYANKPVRSALVGILMIVFLTFLNTLGVRLGKLIQNIFTSAKRYRCSG